MTQPPMLKVGTPEYEANWSLYERLWAMIPGSKTQPGADVLVTGADAVGYALVAFLNDLLGTHWIDAAGDGWPVWDLVETDMAEAIEQLKEVKAQMQKIAPPRMQCGVTSRFEEPEDDAAWDQVWSPFALRHAVGTGELTVEDCWPTDVAAFEKFIEPYRIGMEMAYALVDDVPHVAGWVQGDYQFWVWDLYPDAPEHVVVIEDQPYCGCYCLPPLAEWPNFTRQGETYVP